MPLPDLLALLVALGTLFWFLILAKRRSDEIEDLDDYLFYGRTLEAKGYTRTFVATGISLATVLTFFLDFGGQFGFALLISPLAYLFGVWLILRALPAMRSSGYIAQGTTLHSFLGRTFQSDSLRIVATAVSLLGYMGILIIELHVGVKIFSVIYASTSALFATVTLLAVVIWIYTWLGGFKAVVDTDKAQLALIFLATIAGLVYLSYAVFSSPTIWREFPVELLNPNPLNLPLSLLVVMIVGNIPLQIARMSNWQRIAAVGDEMKVRRGLTAAIWMTFLFWFLFNSMGVLFETLIAGSDPTGMRTVALLDLMAAHGGAVATLLYPIFFVGLVAALISTADSVFVPILTAWMYDLKHHASLHDEDGWGRPQESDVLRTYLSDARRSVKWFMIAVLILYGLLVYAAKFDFVSLLFVFFNQQLVLFPVVFCALAGRSLADRWSKASAIASIGLGWVGVWIATIWGTWTENQDLVFYAAPIGLGMSLLVALSGSSTLRASFWLSISRLKHSK